MSDKGDTGQPIGAPPIQPPKRKRLSRACNWCRKQKVRCDESLPSCLNCRLRNLHCITTEPKSGKEISSSDRKHSAKHKSLRSETDPQPSPCRSDPDSPYSSTTASTATSLLASATPVSLRIGSFSTTTSTLAAGNSAPEPWTTLPMPETTYARPRASSRAGLPQSPPKPPTDAAGSYQEQPRGHAVLTPQSSDYAINYGDEPVRRKFLGASSSQVLVQWLDLSFSRRGPWPRVSQFFRYGISTAEEFPHNLWNTPKPLPPYSECVKYLSVYRSRIHPLFPVLDTPDFTGICKSLAEKEARTLDLAELPSLACCYAVTSIGMDAISAEPSELATEYLTSAYAMYAHIVAMPYLRSIQALLLLALALRGRHKEGVAWHVIGHAVRMAQSLGLHRHQHSHNATSDVSTSQTDLDRDIWWSLFCLEKMMALQTGRPSAIRDEDCDQTVPAQDTSPFLHHLIGLAQVQSAIAHSMTTQINRKKGMRDFFHEAAQLDAQLVEWASRLPDNLRPGSTLYCTPEDQPFATFFLANYHEALITLHRTALILDTSVFREQVKRHVPDGQTSYRISQAEDICIASARAIVRALNELKSSCGDLAHLLTASASILATFVLTISILKHPARWNARSDLALLLNIATFTENIFVSVGQDPTFNKMFALMRDAASKHAEHAAPGLGVSTSSKHAEHNSQSSSSQEALAQQQASTASSLFGDTVDHHDPTQPSSLDLLGTEEPWSQLLSGNLELGIAPWDHDLETFLGLPHFDEGGLGL